jgi:GT2 family glycosyltransferase
VVLPTYNEVENLTTLVRAVLERAPDVHILVVDDASPDGTGELAEELKAEHPGRVDVVHRRSKQGLGTAYVLAFRMALERGYERVVTMDADLSHAPEHLPAILRAAGNADLVIGSRYIPGGRTVGWGLDRKVLSLGANVFARRALGFRVRDCTSGYRCYHRRFLEAIDLDEIVADGYSFQIEMVWRCLRAGLSAREVPIVFVERAHGTSKISSDEVGKALFTVLNIRSSERELRSGAVERPSPRPLRRARPQAGESPVELSIIIVNYDTVDYLRQCLESIERFPPGCRYEVLVVDNDSPDGSADLVRERFPEARLLLLRENVGFARANNLALRQARGRHLLLLNSDTQVLEGSLDGLLEAMASNPHVGAVGCKQLDGNQQLQLTWGRFPTFLHEIVRKALHWRMRIDGSQVREYLDRKYNAPSTVDWVSGSCLLVRREAMEEAGALDENIFMYFEDIDWCRRIQLHGWGILYEPGVRILHYGGVSAARHLIDALVAYRRSQFYFCRKYYGTRALLVLKGLVGLKSALAFLRYSLAWLAAAGDREERFKAYCMLLTLKKILQSLFGRVPLSGAGPGGPGSGGEALDRAALDVREAS